MNANKKLHILFVSTWFPSQVEKFNGDFVQRHALAVSTIHKVTAIHTIGDSTINETKITDNIINENYREIIVYFPKSRFKLLNFIKKMRGYHIAAKRIDDYDLIHANVIYYNLFWVFLQRIFKNKKYIITEHSTAYYGRFSWFRKQFTRLICHFAETIMPVSRRLANKMQEYGFSGNYKIIPNVVDTNCFNLKLDIKNKKPKFLHISSLKDDHKNITGQLMAARILAEKGFDFEFHIGGNGDTTPIQEFIKKHNAHYIHFFGALSHSEVAEKMKEADVFILFSNKENQPCVIIESFSVGTPVISTNVGGISEFFPENFGILIPANDVNALVKAMSSAITSRKFSNITEMHKYAEDNFSSQTIASKFSSIYLSILKKS